MFIDRHPQIGIGLGKVEIAFDKRPIRSSPPSRKAALRWHAHSANVQVLIASTSASAFSNIL